MAIVEKQSIVQELIPDNVQKRIQRYLDKGLDRLDPKAKDWLQSHREDWWRLRTMLRCEAVKKRMESDTPMSETQQQTVASMLEQVPRDER